MNDPQGTNLRVLVVDDGALYRKLLTELLEQLPGVEVIGTAGTGKIALLKIVSLCPDVITLDLEMPEVDGLEVLRRLPELGEKAPLVVVVSAYTRMHASANVEAMELGAFDFIEKPRVARVGENKQEMLRQLRPVIAAARTRASAAGGALGGSEPPRSEPPRCEPPIERAPMPRKAPPRIERPRDPGERVDLVAIGISTGGPKALASLIPSLPGNLRVPVLIVQHIPRAFSSAIAESLNKKSALTVVEGRDGEALRGGTVYIAPGERQMKVVRGGAAGSRMLRITDDPPVNECRPSADYLFWSVAETFGGRALGIIMTGMGADGVEGLRLMKHHGATIIAQDQASCVVFGMPKEAIRTGIVDVVAPLDRIADEIVARVGL